MTTANELIDVIRVQLQEAASAAKCQACGCFRSTLDELSETPLGAGELAEVIAAGRAPLQTQRYDCLGCAACFPAVAMNAYHEAFPDAAMAVETCPTQPAEERAGWPPLPGDYFVHRYRSPVAICTLNSEALGEELIGLAPDDLAIVGSLHTENLGIERVIHNVLANPNIRFLVLCGEDTQQTVGHLPGQSFVSLAANGVDATGRIVGALGKRPVLKNVTAGDVAGFRRQVEVLDLIGETRTGEIIRTLEECAQRTPGQFSDAATPSAIEAIRAREVGPLVQDPAGFLVIYPDRSHGLLVVEHYSNAGVLGCTIEGVSSPEVAQEVVGRGLISRLDHAAYMGRELARAERCLVTGERYVQDRAPDRSACVDYGCSCQG